MCHTLIPIWVEKYVRGEFDDDAVEEELIRNTRRESRPSNGLSDVRLLRSSFKRGFAARRECHELCVSWSAHAGFRYDHAVKRSSNIMANWLRAANHSLTFLPPFSKLRIAK